MYYPGRISVKQLMSKLATDPRVLILDKESNRYIAVQPSRLGLKMAVVLGFEVVMLETDPIKLVCVSKQSTGFPASSVENAHLREGGEMNG